MPNLFELAMKKKTDSRKFKDWKASLKDDIKLPGDFNQDSVKIQPYFNPRCQSNECVYDLKTLEKIYQEFNEIDDEFEPGEEFVCNYCGEKLKFGDFYASKDLESIVNKMLNSQQVSEKDGGSDAGDGDGEGDDIEGDDKRDNDSDSGGEDSSDREKDDRSDATSKQDFESKTASSLKSVDVNDIEFQKDVPDINAYNNIEVEEYSYIIDTQKREKIFNIEEDRLSFNTTHGVKIAISEFSKVVRNKELNNQIYDVILFEYWRAIFVKSMNKKLPLYFYQIENDSPKHFKLKVRDVSSRRVIKDDIKNDEMGIFVIAVKRQMNLFVYDYNTERLTYISCDRKEHMEDDYSEAVLKKKAELFSRFNQIKFKNDQLEISETVNMYLEINNNITKKLYVHFYIAQQELKLPSNKLVNFFDLLLWIMFKLNLKTKEELSEIAAMDNVEGADGISPRYDENGSQRLGTREGSDNSYNKPEGVDPEDIKNFQNFYALLWYYYYYDRPRYKQIWKEYEKRFSSAILQNAGLNPEILDEDVRSQSIKTFPDDTSSQSTIKPKKQKKIPKTDSYIEELIGNKSLEVNQQNIPHARRTLTHEDDFEFRPPSVKGGINKVSSLPVIKSSFKDNSILSQAKPSKKGFMQMESLPPVNSHRAFKPMAKKHNPNYEEADEDEAFLKRLADDSRIMKIHQNNVRQFPHLYDESSENVKVRKPIGRDDVVDKGLNIVSKPDLVEFEKSGYMKDALLNFFIGYLRDKQEKMDSNLLERYNLRTFFFTADMYRLYIADLSKKFFITKFERVKGMTKPYMKPNKTIFEAFQKVAIPVIEMNNTIESYKLIIVDSSRREIILYDPLLSTTRNPDEPKDNRHLIAIANYVEQEYFDKAQVEADVYNTWSFNIADCTSTEDIRHTGLFTAYYLYILAKGMKQPFFKGKDLNSFIAKIASTVRQRLL